MSEHRAQLERFRSRLRTFLLGPQLLAFMPAVTLGGFWIGGETALILVALILPAGFALGGLYRSPLPLAAETDPVTGLALRSTALITADRFLASNAKKATTAAFAIGLDDYPELCKRLDASAADLVLRTCANRVLSTLRGKDLVARLEGPRLACVIEPGDRTDLDALVQISNRILRELEEPVIIDGSRVFISASIGFCTWRAAPEKTGEALLAAAEQALSEASAHGCGSIRAFAPDMHRRAQQRHDLAIDLPNAIEAEEIRPWFQPQVSAESGEITGFEALARWEHPKRGLIPPAEFLGTAEELGLMERFGEKILYQSLGALRDWDTAGLKVPALSVNFSQDELRNPMLVDKVRWELDRFGIAPARLVVEVLETVIAQTANDIVVRNLRAFAELGCRIDLDDFGTGHASITNIKRFSVSRIKIDRSFVTQLDTDSEQRTIVSAIQTMAGRLGLETLAEGVETPGEHATLRGLGCNFIQGFAIAKPMPFSDVQPWLEAYRNRISTEDAPAQAPPPSPPSLPAETAGKTA
ncbi:MAG: bifunctional diguanylate cyclase/phosphodiesterase [Pseudomonadota bacterium]